MPLTIPQLKLKQLDQLEQLEMLKKTEKSRLTKREPVLIMAVDQVEPVEVGVGVGVAEQTGRRE